MYQRHVLSDHVFLIGCWSLSCQKLSDQYVLIMASPAVARLCVHARLLAAARLCAPKQDVFFPRYFLRQDHSTCDLWRENSGSAANYTVALVCFDPLHFVSANAQ